MAYDETVTGIVLSATPIGEYDKRVVLLTRERGKITAFARGARRPGNMLMAPTSPFAFGEFSVYKGKNSYSLSKADIKEYFRSLSLDYEKTCFGFYFLEVCEYFGLEGQDETNLITLLYVAVKALERGAVDRRLIKAVFEFKCLYLNGTYPDVFKCASCGAEERLVLMSTADSCVYCDECARESRNLGVFLSPACMYALRYIIESPANRLFSFELEESARDELVRTVGKFFYRYTEHKFKSEEFLI